MRLQARAALPVTAADGPDRRADMHPEPMVYLARHCVDRGLARHKIPEQLELVGALPRNAMGKVLKHVLRAG